MTIASEIQAAISAAKKNLRQSEVLELEELLQEWRTGRVSEKYVREEIRRLGLASHRDRIALASSRRQRTKLGLDSMVNVMAQGIMRAAAHMVRNKYPQLKDRTDELTQNLRSVLKAKFPSLQAEWKEGLESGLGEPWLRKMVEVQCVELAKEAVEMTLRQTGLSSCRDRIALAAVRRELGKEDDERVSDARMAQAVGQIRVLIRQGVPPAQAVMRIVDAYGFGDLDVADVERTFKVGRGSMAAVRRELAYYPDRYFKHKGAKERAEAEGLGDVEDWDLTVEGLKAKQSEADEQHVDLPNPERRRRGLY